MCACRGTAREFRPHENQFYWPPKPAVRPAENSDTDLHRTMHFNIFGYSYICEKINMKVSWWGEN